MEDGITAIQSAFWELASSIFFLLETKGQTTARSGPGQEESDSRRILADLHWNIQRLQKSCDMVRQTIQLARKKSSLENRPSQHEQETSDHRLLEGSHSGVGSGVELNTEKLQALLLDLQEVVARTSIPVRVPKAIL
ncbi:hypothetical protein KFL_002640030 [Klebsormidium nitens]|uniref:Uncharacterized protein n=1 Tax=Klebsormidium nitens TaxID=105231 RepID=A0A0U9HKH5_KLENI|nr:hypothetical protein KFL_002640030 [Klebsormidium nitens]|eukprot:GAQ85981.1 hypothetical protein KFL_002640030 [Klebsormidium nitens]